MGKKAEGVRWSILAMLCLMGFPGVNWAHHSFAIYDLNKEIPLAGTVREFRWTNPHIYIYLQVPDEQGKVTEWAVEVGTPNINIRHGWKPTDMKTGDKVTMRVRPRRNGAPGATLIAVNLPDGRVQYGTGNDFTGDQP